MYDRINYIRYIVAKAQARRSHTERYAIAKFLNLLKYNQKEVV
ncbi:hypothetical protein [Fortiea sp. LEGE XX443]